MVKLTQTVQKGGCAAKVAAIELRKILSQVQFPAPHSDLLIDGRDFDDAAIYKVTPEIAMVQTLDFFTPIVDSPKLFGGIAAVNSLSDVYAMGGSPKTAMGILAFPVATMSSEIIAEILQGASLKVAEANANFVGGHSIDDDTLKFGLSVTGFVHPKRIWSNTGAKVGDHLILTKPLGTGTSMAALKKQIVSEESLAEVTQSMMMLNDVASVLSAQSLHSINSATDVTGFGLLGHLYQMMKASSKKCKIEFDNIPLFENTLKFLESGFLTKAHRSNKEYTSASIDIESLNELQKLSLFDPQTSGGLLLSVSENQSAEILKELKRKFPRSKIMGVVQNDSGQSNEAHITCQA